jgi:hypothetical protein
VWHRSVGLITLKSCCFRVQMSWQLAATGFTPLHIALAYRGTQDATHHILHILLYRCFSVKSRARSRKHRHRSMCRIRWSASSVPPYPTAMCRGVSRWRSVGHDLCARKQQRFNAISPSDVRRPTQWPTSIPRPYWIQRVGSLHVHIQREIC